MPRDAIISSSAATDETQTNWNGILGYLRLRTEEQVFVGDIRVYPDQSTVTVKMKLYAGHQYNGEISLCCDALKESAKQSVSTRDEVTEVVFDSLPLNENARRWDLEEGNMYEMLVSITGGETKAVTFGIRDFGDDGQGRLAINGRVFFLRSEANCAVFPETGHPPMTVEEWTDILKRYGSYGVNCMRFHSHCPPEAAFTAADRMGMLMQPELSHWNPKDAFESESSFTYYRTELVQMLRMLANHPSFVMLTLGNELQAGEKGHERMRELLRLARDIDSTRLYADASNCHYGEIGCEEANDFYTASNFYDGQLRGTYANMEGYINNCYPDGKSNYDGAMERLRQAYEKPEHFRSFFRDQLPLVLLPKYTWENREKLCARVKVANYGKKVLCGQLEYVLEEQPRDGRGYSLAGCEESARVIAQGVIDQVTCPAATLTEAGTIEISLDTLQIFEPVRLNLIVRIGETELENKTASKQKRPEGNSAVKRLNFLPPIRAL